VAESLAPSSAASAYFGDGFERAHGGGVEGGHGGAAEVKRLLEHHREQEKALLQAALQAAQQALQQAAERAAEHKVEIEQLKAEIAEMKVKMATLKQRPGATRPGEPQPPPAWMPNTDVQHTRQEKLLSSLVEQLRGGVAESKAAQLEVVGKIGHVAGKLDQVTDRLSFLEQEVDLQVKVRSTGQNQLV
jgi:phage-related minor tail protein